MVVILGEQQLEIRRAGLSKEVEKYLGDELSWRTETGILTHTVTTSRYTVYGKHKVLYNLLRRISKDYTVELV